MNNRTKFYVYAVSAIGILLTIECAASFFGEFAQTLTIANLPLLVIPVAVCAICRSLPLYIRQNETLDVSVSWLIHEDLKKIWIRGKKIELERGK